MSSEKPKGPVIVSKSPEPPEEELYRQGCLGTFASMGLAIYATLILSVAIGGLFCGASTLFNSMRGSDDKGEELTSGIGASQWRLQSLRRWGVLEEGATPDLYHDHSPFRDGTAGCMVIDGVVSRWDREELTGRVSLEGATVGGDERMVTIENGGESISCPFGRGQGGDRFLSMLSVSTGEE